MSFIGLFNSSFSQSINQSVHQSIYQTFRNLSLFTWAIAYQVRCSHIVYSIRMPDKNTRKSNLVLLSISTCIATEFLMTRGPSLTLIFLSFFRTTCKGGWIQTAQQHCVASTVADADSTISNLFFFRVGQYSLDPVKHH